MPKSFPGGRSWPASRFFYHIPFSPITQPEQLVIPLWYGGRASVSEGGKVKANSAVGHDRNGLPAFTKLAGKVRAVADFSHLVARPKEFDFPRLSVTVDVDTKQPEAAPPFKPQPRFWELTHQELCARLFQAGVMDIRQAALPDVVLYNALDPEPPLSANLRLLMERPRELLEGMRILNQLHRARWTRIAISRESGQLEARLRTMLASAVNLSLAMLDSVHPQQRPALLKQALSPEEDCAIYGMETALQVREAVVLGLPAATARCTVWNQAARTQANAEVPVGATARQVLGTDEETARHRKLVFGGLLSGRSHYSLEMPVARGTAGVLLLDVPQEQHATACTNCGRCGGICPSRLDPSEIYRAVRDCRTDRVGRLRLVGCLDCGLCSFICPARLELLQQLETGRMLMEGRLR